MRIDVVTIFPQMFPGPLGFSIVQIAQQKKLVQLVIHNLRSFVSDRHLTVDDKPYGGGRGMVLQCLPIFKAVSAIKEEACLPRQRVILLSPQGRLLDQIYAEELAKEEHLVIICGHYEGIDERVSESVVTDEISVGDYVLTGGELPAMVLIDCVVRLVAGVLDEECVKQETFSEYLCDFPQYTRPFELAGKTVPSVLLSGDHQRINIWRQSQRVIKTYLKKRTLLEKIFFQKLQNREVSDNELQDQTP